MSELLALRAPYSDMMKNDDGDSILSMDQITAMTMRKDGGVRPSLPDDIDAGMLSLVRRSWSSDASLRPSFSSILFHLDEMSHARNRSFKLRGGKQVDDKLTTTTKQSAASLCRRLHNLLTHYKPTEWSERKAATVVDANASITAKDVTLNEVLSLEKGPTCIKALGWVMFGGLEKGAQITPEPLVDEDDIVVDVEKKSALVYIHFAIKVKAEAQEETEDYENAFDGLQRALREAERAVSSEGKVKLETAVAQAAASEQGRQKPKRKLGLKKKKKKKKEAGMMSKEDRQLMRFIKATRYVRGVGADKIHPSAKVRLFGLRMQAQHGDATPESIPGALSVGAESAPKNSKDGKAVEKSFKAGSAVSVQKLKLRSWSAVKGKSREDAMSEYLDLLGSIVPQWRVAHVLGAHESMQDDKPRMMLWVLNVSFRQLGEDEARVESTKFLGKFSVYRFTLFTCAHRGTRQLIAAITTARPLRRYNKDRLRKFKGSVVAFPRYLDRDSPV